ncbi:UNVERIFIED_CONTAM: protein TAR1 [Sesamum radiatum]|uniref:Protein TAR1 n=2 Tax=asterids TaxID=71274 RepID=A0AAW2JH82_SESRA
MCKCRSHGTFPLFGLQSSHLNICYYHQDPHRRPLRPGSRPGFCSDRRALLLIGAWPLPRRPGIGRALQRHPFSGLVDSADERFARQYRCGPPPEFPLASPRSGIVHHLSGPDRYAHSNPSQKIKVGRRCTPRGDRVRQLPCASRVCSPVDSHTCQTPWSVFQDGSNGEPAGQRRERAVAEARRRRALSATIGATAFRGHIDCPGFGRRLNPRWSAPRADRRTGSRRSTSDRGASPAPIRFPPDNFKHSLTLFSKSFSSFPRGTCSLSVSRPYLALDGIYRPFGAAFPNNPTRRQRLVVRQGPGTTGLSPSPAPLSRGLGPGPPLRTLLQTTIRTAKPPDSQVGLFPVRSPLLGESLRGRLWVQRDARADDGTTARELRVQPPLAVTSVAAGSHLGRPRARAHGRPFSAPAHMGGATRCVTPRQTCPGLMASGATCVQRLDGSRDSAIHTKYRISLRSSSMREPRYPLPRVVLTFERRPLRPCTPRERGPRAADASFGFPWRVPRRGFVSPHGPRSRARAGGSGARTGAFAPRPSPDFVGNVFAVCFSRFRQ